MLAISTELVPVQLLSGVNPPTTMSSLWERTTTGHWHRGGWWSPRSWLLCGTCEWQLFLHHLNLLHPLLAVVHLVRDTWKRYITGVSASWCHIWANDSCAPKDCGWQDLQRAASEQVNTDLEYLFATLIKTSQHVNLVSTECCWC